MPRKAIVATCIDCQEPFTEEVQRYAHCSSCREKHKAAWREEHTRKPGDKRSGWLIGDLCTVQLKGTWYKGKILDMSDRADGDYLLTKLELSKTVKDWSGNEMTHTWIHPEPVQSYKLRKREVWR